MKKYAAIVLLSMLSLSICGAAAAESGKLSNTNERNMDLPAAGDFEAFKPEKDLLVTEYKFEWSKEQLYNLHRTLPHAYIPSFVLQDSEFDGLQPVGVMTSLPGVKVEKLDSNEDGVDDQLRLYVTDPSSLIPGKQYEMTTIWRYRGTDNPSIRMSSFLSHPQPSNGMINNLWGTMDSLFRFTWDQVKERQWTHPVQKQHQAADHTPMYYAKLNWTNYAAKDSGRLNAGFLHIHSPEQLEQYRAGQNKRLHELSDEDGFQRFAVTYAKPQFLTYEQLYDNYDYLVTQVYQIGKNEDGEEVTIVSFDQDHRMPIELLREKKISSFAVTEWEGIAYSSKIKELAGTAYSVDTPYQNHRPTGMFWIKNKFGKEASK
ncbi:hypothetical protein [Paenibacillus naphthalenovorans]|uniref:hypothetical protein n=1 Tax=Paenibacillus naphthalenovorans TaxID=162209 RepID=UPI003D29FD72